MRGTTTRWPDAGPEPPTLDERMERCETVLEDLQDAFYRQAVRQDRAIEELRERTKPAQMARDLSRDARRRGL